MADGFIHSTESFGAADGPGVRFLVFVSGCPYRCKYCHNPDTWFRQGTRMTADELLAKALRNKPYWEDVGGITVSGGEPLGQIDFLLEFFQKAKKEGVHTCIDHIKDTVIPSYLTGYLRDKIIPYLFFVVSRNAGNVAYHLAYRVGKRSVFYKRSHYLSRFDHMRTVKSGAHA